MSMLPHDVYREQLTSLFQGHALWEPDPNDLYKEVSVGDVGYIREGYFFRMFNVLFEWNHPSNYTLCEPEPYSRLDLGPFNNICELKFSRGDYRSRFVTSTSGTTDTMVAGRDDSGSSGTSYICKRKQGALLMLPQDGLRKDAIRTKKFEDHIRDHVDRWFSFAQRRKLDVERMEDLILVTGCTLVTSWGIAAFVDSTKDAEVLLKFSGKDFDWREIHPSVTYQNSSPYNQAPNQCVFIRGFRAKRRAEPPRNRRELQVTRYRDPLSGVLEYLATKCQNDIVTIVHDDDLQLIGNVDTLTADEVESFLCQSNVPVLTKNGAAILHGDEEEIHEDKIAVFYATAEQSGEPVPLVLHPVLSKYLLKIEIDNQLEHDYNLPKEDITSPASHPPMVSLKLENDQGYPQDITVQVSSGTSSVGVTVQDVLRTIHEDLRRPWGSYEWTNLKAEERAAINAAFRKRCTTEEELGQGPCRIDYLRGRDRLQVLPKLPLDETHERLLAPNPNQESASREAGPSRIQR